MLRTFSRNIHTLKLHADECLEMHFILYGVLRSIIKLFVNRIVSTNEQHDTYERYELLCDL